MITLSMTENYLKFDCWVNETKWEKDCNTRDGLSLSIFARNMTFSASCFFPTVAPCVMPSLLAYIPQTQLTIVVCNIPCAFFSGDFGPLIVASQQDSSPRSLTKDVCSLSLKSTWCYLVFTSSSLRGLCFARRRLFVEHFMILLFAMLHLYCDVGETNFPCQ